MSAIKTLLEMLISDLVISTENIDLFKPELANYNELLGCTSVELAALLESLLLENYSDWDREKWIDDSLLDYFEAKNEKISIGGVMIWGRVDVNKQWVAPFLFEMELLEDKSGFKSFTFLFRDLDNPEILYEEFRDNRDYYKGYDINWDYIINSIA